MKSFLNKLLAVSSLTLLVLSSSCKKDGTIVTATNGTGGTLTSSTNTLVLNSAKLTDVSTIITFNFTQASYGYQSAITNTLQIDAASDNWANPYTVALGTNVFTQAYNTPDFNAIMLKIGLKGGVAGQVNVRVKSAIGTNTFVYTNIAALTITPFNLKSWLYTVGAFQGWNINGTDSLYSATSNNIYIGIANFTAGNNQFLVVPKKGSYDNKYATNDAINVTSSNVAQGGGNNFSAPTVAGQYLVTLNLNTNKITFALVDYYTIIGDAAQGWGTDVAMKYVNDGNSNWAVTLPLLSSGSFKIREDVDWTYSWGIPKANTDGYGIANTLNRTSNDNITITSSGSYAVTFNAPITLYTTTPPPAPASTTATYSVVKQ
ncbi:SusE-like outer membrane protein [Mucilaginibacter gracilis]|uniref:SusE-like outer membrane protein n=1 Tax=Mucilaginibacter gracilis TaxID=423350 RepID=A0A495J3J3_9SPHI|nr:SusE domain-containing protein [Mucilaginibacter gracilis]RKR83555.1 SusE-like outer membrane protein [Mucilaginibacter gracilis]